MSATSVSLGSEGIVAAGQIAGHVLSHFVGRQGAGLAGVDVGNGDRDVRDDRSGSIGDGARQRARILLLSACERWRRLGLLERRRRHFAHSVVTSGCRHSDGNYRHSGPAWQT
jgi:hypothetical protein